MPLTASSAESGRAKQIVASLIAYTLENKTVKVGLPEFAGLVGEYGYSFEGEEDLLHLAVERRDSDPLTVEEAQEVVAFVLPHLAPGVIWVKPGTVSHHFYFGHDELLES